MPRGKRKRVATNIYRDQHGYAGIVQVRGLREEIRFPRTASIPEMRRRLETRYHELSQLAPAVERGTLAAVVQSYLDRLSEPRKTDRRQLLRPWVDALGDRPFSRLDRAALQHVTEDWRTAGLSASRINKRISALRVAWDTIAPDAPPHPIARVSRFTEPPAVAKGIPLDLVSDILAHVEDDRVQAGRTTVVESKAKARLRVLAWTGQPPARIMAIRPSDVRWGTTPPELYVQPRRKGTGSADAWIPLVPQAVDALKQFFRVQADGPFNLRPVAKALAIGVRRAQQTLRIAHRYEDAARLDGFTVYGLRHSFLSAMGATAPDIYAVAEYAGHASLQTTRRYMRSAASPRMRQSVAALTPALPVPTTSANERRRKVQRKRTKGTKGADF